MTASIRLGTRYEVELEGADAVLARLGEAAGRMEHAKPMFDAIGAMLVTSTQHRFEIETDPKGNPWPKSIRARLTGGKTLTDSAFLRNSMTFEATDAGVAEGTNAIYAALMQLGGVVRPVAARALHFMIGGREVFASKVTIPARAFLGLDEGDEKAIGEIVEDFVLAPVGPSAPRSGPGQPLGGNDAG